MIERVRTDGGSALDYSRALVELREISRDRVLLGDILGDYLHQVVIGTQADTVSNWPALELLRAAGADEDRAAAKATWLRHQQPIQEARAAATDCRTLKGLHPLRTAIPTHIHLGKTLHRVRD